MGVSAPVAALILSGCVTNPNSQNKSTAVTSKLEAAAVSPEKYLGDPVGFGAALMGAPGKEDSPGNFLWDTDNKSRYDELNKSMLSWCKANGGTVPSTEQSYKFCMNSSGEAITRYRVAMGPVLKFNVYTPEAAKYLANKFKSDRDEHKKYVESNGARGKITLTDKRTFDVVRFGSASESIDYLINIGDKGETTELRKIKSIRRISSPTGNSNGSFEVELKDGKIVPSPNGFPGRHLRMKPDGSLGSDTIDFGELVSSHVVLVIKMPSDPKPRQVRISSRDIGKIDIQSIDNTPLVPLSIQTKDDDLASRLKQYWSRNASASSSFTYDPRDSWRHFCNRLNYGTIETRLICDQIAKEEQTVTRTGKLTPSTTPAMLSGHYDYRAHISRSLF